MKRFIHLIRYIRLLKRNKKVLSDSRINKNPNPLGVQYDWIYRLYTVLNLPFEDQENANKYGVYYIDNMVREHVAKINNFLFELGILEYVELDTDNIIQIDEFNIKIVLKFKYMNTKTLAKFSIVLLVLAVIAGIVSLFIFI